MEVVHGEENVAQEGGGFDVRNEARVRGVMIDSLGVQGAAADDENLVDVVVCVARMQSIVEAVATEI